MYKAPREVLPEAPTGFYFGGHIGGGWASSEYSNTFGIASPAFSDRANAFLGGVQLGYNWQFGPTVLGLQGDISFTDMHSAAFDPTLITATARNTTKWISTFTGRYGYAWDRSLWYAKGGEAWVRNHYALSNNIGPTSATASSTRSGYVVGGGWEYAFAPGWSGFLEYNYIGLSRKDIGLTDPVNGATAFTVAQNIQMVKLGINVKLRPWPYPLPRW